MQPTLRGQNACVYLDYDSSSDIPPKTDGWTRFVCLSDTHSKIHWDREGRMPRGDILVHAGDLGSWGKVNQLRKSINWLGNLKGYGTKIIIAGNHDMWLDKQSRDLTRFDEEERTTMLEACDKMMAKSRLREKKLTYLQFEQKRIKVKTTEKEWLVYGSPASPLHTTGSFQYETRAEAEEIYAKIPSGVEILVTHTPPYMICDKTRKGKHAGCRILGERLVSEDLGRCRLHVFGHIHEAAGAEIVPASEGRVERVAVNAAIPHRGKPIVVDLKN